TSRRSPSPSDGPPAARRASLDARPTRSCAESAGRIRGNRSMALVNPHGHDRRLRPLRLGGRDAAEARRRAESLPRVAMTSRETSDLIMLGMGAFTPLAGFQGHDDWRRVCDEFLTADGVFWPI